MVVFVVLVDAVDVRRRRMRIEVEVTAAADEETNNKCGRASASFERWNR